ncbi:MAG: hypothetical protein N2316_12035 [Spirochaetes bacterium]|nr:hypothetical protein [Spirochaetota bacterium]
MRDDITKTFNDLIELLKEKLHLFEMLYHSNREKRNQLKIDDIDSLAESMQLDAHIIDEINLIDVQLASHKKKIAETCGISEIDFDSHFSAINESIVLSYFKLQHEIEDALIKALGENEAFCNELQETMFNTHKDMEEIGRMKKLFEKIKLVR